MSASGVSLFNSGAEHPGFKELSAVEQCLLLGLNVPFIDASTKKKRVLAACSACKSSRAKCSEIRPCVRCIRAGNSKICVVEPCKKPKQARACA